MAKEYFKAIVAVHALFIQDGKILMLRRANTGYEDGNYSVIAGHLESGEGLTRAMIREVKEESGVDVEPADLTLKTVVHRLDDREQLDFFFEIKQWNGSIKNMEPKKCDDLRWFSLDELPTNTIPYIKKALHCYREEIFYSEIGFEKES